MKIALVAISVSLLVTLVLGGGYFVIAATQPVMPPAVQAPLIVPTNPLYTIKEWWRTLKLKLENDPIKHVGLEQLQMQQRLVDMQGLFSQPIDAKTAAAITTGLDKYQHQEQRVQQQLTILQEQIQEQEVVKRLLRTTTSQKMSQQQLLEQIGKQAPTDNAAVQAAVEKTIQQSFDDLAAAVSTITSYTDGETNLTGAVLSNGTGSIFNRLIFGDILQRVSAVVPKEQVANVRNVAQKVIQGEVEKISDPRTDSAQQKMLLEKFLATPYDPATLQVLSHQPVLNRQLEIIADQTAAKALQDTANLFK